MILSENKPKDMSQLDWLWLNYNHFNVKNDPSEVPSERVILTEQAIRNLIQKASGGGITDLNYQQDPTDPTSMRLVGRSLNGQELALIKIPKEEHIVEFVSRKVTQADIDHGCNYKAGTDVLAITTNLSKTYMVSLSDLNLQISGSETDTIYSEVIHGVVTANLKIDANNNQSAVELKQTNNGIYSKLKLDNSNGLKLEITEKGLKASIPFNADGELNFKSLTWDEYTVLEAIPNTLYFITDKPYIYLNKVRYGIDLKPGEAPITSLVYDKDSMKLYYKKCDGRDIEFIELGAVSEDRNGMLTKEQYKEFKKLIAAIGDIPNIKDYVENKTNTAAFSLELGDEEDQGVPLKLKNANGNIISTVYLEQEDFLSFVEQRAATIEDVVKAKELGVTLKEGQATLILTLVSGDVVYVNLSELADVYTGENTNTIQLSVSNYKISANLLINPNEKLLYASTGGIATRFSIKQDGNKIKFYGKTETELDKLGEFIINDQLLGYTILSDFNQETVNRYPPKQVDGRLYDPIHNPVYFTNNYLVLTLGNSTGDSSTDYKYNLYINLTKHSREVLSKNPDNLLKREEDGSLLATLDWNTI